MDWSRTEALTDRWRRQTREYATAINAYVAKGDAEGWTVAGRQPSDPRTEEDARAIIDLVREANAQGDWRELRARVPVAHAPFVPLLKEQSVGLRGVCWTSATTVAVTAGSPWQPHRVITLSLDGQIDDVADATVGGSPSHWALCRGGEIRVHAIGGDATATLRVPDAHAGLEGIPHLADPEPLSIETLVPMSDEEVLVVAQQGVFRVDPTGPNRVFPAAVDVRMDAEDCESCGDEPFDPDYSMIHAAASPDGSWIVAGHQDSQHLLFDRSGVVRGRFGPVGSSYPHHASISPDGQWVIANSCHFYGGVSTAIRRSDLEGTSLAEHTSDERLTEVDAAARVYASTWHGDHWVFGDANGYVFASSVQGERQWRHFVGSTVGGVAVSPDGRHLAVSTYAGFLVILDLQASEPDPTLIGTSGFSERLRMVVWKGERPWLW